MKDFSKFFYREKALTPGPDFLFHQGFQQLTDRHMRGESGKNVKPEYQSDVSLKDPLQDQIILSENVLQTRCLFSPILPRLHRHLPRLGLGPEPGSRQMHRYWPLFDSVRGIKSGRRRWHHYPACPMNPLSLNNRGMILLPP